MASLTVVKGHITVGLWGQNLGRFFYCLKTRFRGFKWFGTYLKFPLLCVRACMRACVRACTHTYQVLCVEVVLGFWSDQSETYTYWKYMGWSFAPLLGGDVDSSIYMWEARNLGPHSIWLIQAIFSNVLTWTPPRVLVGSIWNIFRLNIYGLKLNTSPWGRCRCGLLSVRGIRT